MFHRRAYISVMKKYRYLTDTERRAIRRLHETGLSYRQVGTLKHRSHVVVRRVVLGIDQKKNAGQRLDSLTGARGLAAEGDGVAVHRATH
jgi:Helix-turn-helix domain